MKGLILKDLYLIKSNMRMLIILVVYSIFMLMSDFSSIIFALPFFVIMIIFSTFSYDEYNKWDAYAATFPNGKKEVVKSKYMVTILLIILASIIALIMTILNSVIKQTGLPFDSMLSNTVSIICSILFLISVLYPLVYKFGLEKGRIAIFFVFAAIALVVTSAFKILGQTNIDYIINLINSNIFIYVLLIFFCLFIYISYKVSKKIYLKKEF